MSVVRQQGGRLELRTRVYLLMAIGTFFPLLVMAGVGFWWMRALDQRVLEARLAAVATVGAHLDEELTGDLEALQRLASAAGAAYEDASPDTARRVVRDTWHYFRHRESVFLLDREKRLLVEEPHGTVSAVPRAAIAAVDEVIASGRPRLTGLALEEDRGGVVHALVPVRRWDGEVVGVAGGTFDPRRRDFARMLERVRGGNEGVADLVDSAGRIVASTAPERAGASWECRMSMAELVEAKRAFSEPCANCHWRRKVDVVTNELVTFVPLSAAPWGIVVREATAAVLPTQRGETWRVVLAALAAHVALTGVLAWGAARGVTQPVGVLTREAERIAGGELGAPIPTLGRDEVGRLGASLERMRGSLQTMVRRVEAANEDLERRVAERTSELAEANLRLEEREAARAELLRKVITAQEDERKRIARELHDETSQSLAVLVMGLESATEALRTGKVPHLDEVKAVAVRTLEDVHRLIFDLRPSVLDDLGLLSAIRWYADRYLATRGISVRCEFGEMDRRLPPEMETALFRMCQEALSNVARHAQASAVLVQVGMEGDAVHIDIEDDGQGFDPEQVGERKDRKHWGLLGIRERAEILGGSAKVESAPGQGTRLVVHVPLPKEQP